MSVLKVHKISTSTCIIQICSGITHGRVLNGELYAQRLQKLIYLHLSTDCFMKTNADKLPSVISVFLYVYVTGKLRNQAFCEMPKNFSHFLNIIYIFVREEKDDHDTE